MCAVAPASHRYFHCFVFYSPIVCKLCSCYPDLCKDMLGLFVLSKSIICISTSTNAFIKVFTIFSSVFPPFFGYKIITYTLFWTVSLVYTNFCLTYVAGVPDVAAPHSINPCEPSAYVHWLNTSLFPASPLPVSTPGSFNTLCHWVMTESVSPYGSIDCTSLGLANAVLFRVAAFCECCSSRIV